MLFPYKIISRNGSCCRLVLFTKWTFLGWQSILFHGNWTQQRDILCFGFNYFVSICAKIYSNEQVSWLAPFVSSSTFQLLCHTINFHLTLPFSWGTGRVGWKFQLLVLGLLCIVCSIYKIPQINLTLEPQCLFWARLTFTYWS